MMIWSSSCSVTMAGIMPARADGGSPLPTNTPTQTSVAGAQSAPSLMMSTPEVKSFEIIIGADQNATVQVVTPANQAILPRLDDQGVTPAQEEQFSSPLWVFGFFFVVIIILVLNSIGRSFRSRE
jgi:hypothetical protein